MAKKITKDELKNVQDKVSLINNAQMQIGGLEVQKTLIIEKLKAFQTELNVIQTSLESKYGKKTVNINDGTLKDIPSENGSLN
tara:strand:+ start:62 stop:310 length:249 start_codon:yes stop_codon:yes gene_type:complete